MKHDHINTDPVTLIRKTLTSKIPILEIPILETLTQKTQNKQPMVLISI